MVTEQAPSRRALRVARIALLVLLVLVTSAAHAAAAFWIVQLSGNQKGDTSAIVFAAVVLLGCLVHGAALRGRGARTAFDVLVLGSLVVWGLVVNHHLDNTCQQGCEDGPWRFLAEPDVFLLLGLHVMTVVAFAVSRRRREALRPLAEVLVHGLLLVGILLHGLLAIHFGDSLVLGVLLPLAMPAIAPLLTVGLYGAELFARLRRRGAEERDRRLSSGPPPPARFAYRSSPSGRSASGVYRGLVLRAAAASSLLVGAYVVVLRLYGSGWGTAARVFTQTCSHTLSHLPVLPRDGTQGCCYVCTVAAQGHPSVVRPERLGRRYGEAIVVNRQLAIASAFEGLLHERWPRFAAWTRRIYDRIGPPLARRIDTRIVADAAYLALKPAEWAFYLALLLLDRASPEERIDRVYR